MHSSAEFRHHMIDGQLEPNQVLSLPITAAMGIVSRELFVPEGYRQSAYLDEPIPYDAHRAMIPPLLLGQLLETADPKAGERVLVIASGTGYGAAVLHHLGCKVYLIEESQDLANKARQTLMKQGLGNIEVHTGPHQLGYHALAPYDVILVEGGAEVMPSAWVEQLADGGRLVYVAIDNPLPLPHRGRGFIKCVTRQGDHCVETVGPGVASTILPGTEIKEGFSFA